MIGATREEDEREESAAHQIAAHRKWNGVG